MTRPGLANILLTVRATSRRSDWRAFWDNLSLLPIALAAGLCLGTLCVVMR